jgi:hypothetical protein
MGLDPGGVKKTWLDSTRLSLEELCFKLSNSGLFFFQSKQSNSMWVSKSLIKMTKPWKEGWKKSFQLSKQTVYSHGKKTPKIYVGAETWSITKPHKLFFFLKLRNFPSKIFSNKLLSLFFPPFFFPFFSLFFGWGWGGLLWCLQQIPTGLWFLFEILNEILRCYLETSTTSCF